jgi:hypothetical protein
VGPRAGPDGYGKSPPHRDSILRKYIFHNAITCQFEVDDNEFLRVIRVLKMASSFRFAFKSFVSFTG